MFNSGYRNRRATDGRGVIGTQTQYLQTISPAISVSSWSISGSDDTALDPAGGQTVLVNGSGFAVGVSATVGGTQIGAVTIVSSTQLSFTSPANAGGSYSLVVYNVDGSAGILVPGLVYSAVPTWTTAAGTIGSFYETTAISTAVVATADSALTYSLSSGSLPVGSTLYANGVITGTAPVDSSSTTYTFAVTATDAELQDTTRTFTLTVNVDVVTWVTPGTSATITLDGSAYSQALSATDAAGYAVSYTANTLPTGLTLSAGTISGTPTVDGNISSLLTATAATTNRSATNTVTWVVALSDTYFQYVALGMSANQSIETQSFVADNSTNNAQLTVFGDTRAQKSNPYQAGYYSVFHPSTTNGWQTPANTATNIIGTATLNSTSTFTFEAWIYPLARHSGGGSVLGYVFGSMNITGGQLDWSIGPDSNGKLTVFWYNSGNFVCNSTNVIALNNWTHIAVVVNVGVISLFINGTKETLSGTTTATTTSGSVLGYLSSGGYTYAGTTWQGFNGYISNLRVVKGIPLYTATFTPSTSPLLPIAGTTLLTNQSNRFSDNSINNYTLTLTNSPTITPAAPFATVYQASTQYYSGSFNGSSDYLTLATSPTLGLGTGDFTIEYWCYPNSISGTPTLIDFRSSAGDTVISDYLSSGAPVIYINSTNAATSSQALSAGAWAHVAYTRSGTTLRIFVNGVQTASVTNSYNMGSSQPLRIANNIAGSAYFNGYISNLRVVKGLAVYTGNFVPATAPLAATQSSGTNTAAITQPSYSVLFNGSSQYLTLPTSSSLQLGSLDFTFEGWMYLIDTTDRTFVYWNGDTTGEAAVHVRTISGKWALWISKTGTSWEVQQSALGTATANTWYHVAIVRNSTNIRLYINGSDVTGGGYTVTGSLMTTYTLNQIGTYNNGFYFMNGYISNIRLTLNQALYTANFTPTTSPLTTTSQSATAANVGLLTCQSTTIVDNSLNLFAITNTGTTKVASPNPFATGTVSLLTVQSPTFVDSSYNSLAITAVTTTVKSLAQSPFTPVYYSNYFGSSSDYLTVPSNAVYAFGTGDFTIEAWVYLTAYNASFGSQIFGGHNYGVGADMLFVINTTGKLFLQIGNSGVGAITSTSSVSLNTWTHVAIVRSSGTVTPYINGTSAGGAASYTTSVASTLNPGIGSSTNGNSAMSLRGYISNLRVVKGQALYTTTFTPSTTPLTLTSQGATAGNVSLLTCQSPYFIDTSNNSFAIAILGSPRIAGIAPFTQPGGYSATAVTTYGSGYFDGTGDYVSVPDNAYLELGANNFTMEFWLYSGTTAQALLIGKRANQTTNGPVAVFKDSSNVIKLYLSTGTSTWDIINGATIGTVVNNTWYHIAVTRSGSTFTGYFNGISVSLGTSASTVGNTSDAWLIGGDTNGNSLNGYITDVRIVIGSALYASSFVPQFTAPLTAVTNTQLLTLQTRGAHNNSDFVDQSSFNNLVTRAGNTTNGTFDPYGNNFSNYFATTASYISAPIASFPNSGTTWTIEGWFNLTTVSGTVGFFTSPDLLECKYSGTTFTVLYRQNPANAAWVGPTGTITLAVGTWYHIAISVNAGSMRLFINGTQLGSTTTVAAGAWGGSGSNSMIIGANDNYIFGSIDSTLAGYASNFRITSTAVYTANFTPTTSPLTAITGTTLLTCQGNRFFDVSPLNNTITVTGTPTVQKFSPFSTVTVPTYYSGYFDGTGDYLNIAAGNTALNLGTGDFTLECWIYATSSGTSAIVDNRNPDTANAGFDLDWLTPNKIRFSTSGTAFIDSATTVSTNTWYHLALTRSSNLFKLYINGTVDSNTYTGSSTQNFTNTNFRIGSGQNGAFSGYISNLRITKGQVLYTTNFTPSTTPLTTTSQGATAANVSLLTCQSNTFIDNSPNYLAITATGDAKPLAVSPFTPTASSPVSYTPTTFGGSMYFDGTGDYLVGPASNTNLYPGAGDFTIDFWNYLPANPTTGYYTVFGYGSATPNLLMFYTAATSKIEIFNNATVKLNPSWPAAGQWNHFALVRSGTTLSIYINGVFSQSTTEASDFVGTLYIGADFNGARNILGYISDFRIVKGTALYTANFYPGATPATPTYTIGTTTYSSNLLLSGATGGVIDYSRTVDLETVADAKVTPFSPYAGSYYSNYFSSSSYLSTSKAGGWLTSGSNFTVEAWAYLTAYAAASTGNYASSIMATASGSTGWDLSFWGTATSFTSVSYYHKGANISATYTGTISLNTWYHVAAVRSGTTVTVYVNGVAGATTATLSTWTENTGLLIAADGVAGYPYYLNGYISNLRIVNGQALYTTNFTPSTTPLTTTSQGATAGNVALLTCQSNKFVDNSSNAFTLTTSGTPKVATQNPFALNSGISYYFDGTGDYLTMPENTALWYLGTGDFTIEAWVNPAARVANSAYIIGRSQYGVGSDWAWWITNSGTLQFYMLTGGGGNIVTSTGTVPLNAWTFVTVVRSSAGVKLYINGVNDGTLANYAGTLTASYGPTVIGNSSNNTGSTYFNGYITDLRFTKGYARYTANFTPPTAPYKLN